MDAGYELSFNAFGQNGDLIAAATAFANPQEFSQGQIKAAQAALSATNEFGPGMFFPDTFDLSAYPAGFNPLGRLPIKSPSATFQDLSIDNLSPVSEHNANLDSPVELDSQDNIIGTPRRKSDGNLSVAQSRRKAQNRAAQRAFRERKERHVRDLEAQLSALNDKATSLQTNNERLLGLLKKVQTENKVLRARSARQSRKGSMSRPVVSRVGSDEASPPYMFMPKNASQDSAMQSPPELSSPSSAASPPDSPWSKSLDPVATWDLLQAHPLFLKGSLDIGQVCERLKSLARCDDSVGPVFDESDVRRVIEEVAGVTDSDLS